MKIRDAAYAPVLALAMGLMLARLLVMVRLLPVAEFATYSLGLLISSSFCMLGCLGVQSLLQRELPVQIVRGRERAGLILSTQCMVIAAGCAVILAIAVSPWKASVPVAWVGLLHGVSQQFFLIATVESRSRAATMRFARQNLMRAGAVTAGGWCAVRFGASGASVLCVEAAVSILAALGLWRRYVSNTKLQWSGVVVVAVKRLPRIPWRPAFALLMIMLLGFVRANADRWIAAKAFVPTEFAQYSFAWIVLMAAQSTQVVINASVFPMLAQRYGQDGARAVFGLARRTSFSLGAIGILLVLPAWVVLEFAVPKLFPAYVPALTLLPLFFVIGILQVSDFWSSYLIIVGQEVRLVRLTLVLVVAVGLTWLAWVWQQGGVPSLVDVAVLPVMLASFGYAATATLAWRLARRQ